MARNKELTISILIPCYNEEKSVKACVQSCLNQTRQPDQIVVVDDASTDGSRKILEAFGSSIDLISLNQNTGNKSHVQEIGLKHVVSDIVITTDADTVLDKDFVKEIEQTFRDHEEKDLAAVAGYVKSLKHNALTAVREIDYVYGQRLHRVAQAYLNTIFVIPGCAGAFRTEIFKKYVQFDHDTVTEDLDFTYKLHEQGFKIAHNLNAVVYTQDPGDLSSYIRQMRRWYGGLWQNIRKHLGQLLKKPSFIFDLSLSLAESFIFSLSLLFLPFISLPIYLWMMGLTGVAMLMVMIFAVWVDKRWDLLIYSPLILIVSYLNAVIFLSEFIKEFVLGKRQMAWLRAERRVI